MTAPRVAPRVVVASVEVSEQICQVRDEAPGFLIVEVPQEPCEGVGVAVPHLVNCWFGRLRQRNDDTAPVSLVVFAHHQPRSCKVADDHAGVGDAHLDPPGQLRDSRRARHSERDEDGNMALTVAPAHLQDGRHLACSPAQGERQLRKKGGQAGDVMVGMLVQETLIVKDPCVIV